MPELAEILLLLTGALAAGFVTGLAGFGTALTAMALWLYVVPPIVAAPLVAVCSLGVHLLTIRQILPGADVRSAVPYLLGALFGIPVGIWLLTYIEPDLFRVAVGLVLIAYPLYTLTSKAAPQLSSSSGSVSAGIGVVSGLMGGFAGLSGPPLVIWSQLCGWAKERARGLLQIINMTIFVVAIAGYGVRGLLSIELLTAAAICLPASLLGGWLGLKAYTRTDPELFRKIILFLLMASGLGLVIPRLL